MLNRREFIKFTALGAGMAACTKVFAEEIHSTGPTSEWPELVAVRNGNITENYDRAIRAIGGMDCFISKGQRVVVKPCMQWALTPGDAANSNPALVERVVQDCFAAGASRVYVLDQCIDYWKNVYSYSGIAAAATRAGAEMAHAHLEKHYACVTIDGAAVLKNPKIHKIVLDADALINLSLLKQDSATAMYGVMSNLAGIVWGRHFAYTNGISRSIADINLFIKPVINILEADKVLTSGGPRGVYNSTYMNANMIIVSPDIKATDTCGAKILGIDPREIGYMGGGYDIEKISIQRITL